VNSPETTRSFGRQHRLRRRGEFQAVFDAGQRLHGRFFTLLVARNRDAQPRLGIVASRKLGNAVHRNRAKRLIRDVFRKNKQLAEPAGLDIVVIPRTALFEATYASIEADFQQVLARCATRLAKHGRS
jgi:ribonuclease P protein component